MEINTFIENTIKEAGQEVMRHFGHAKVTNIKNGRQHDVVTEADLASEKIIKTAIKKEFPNHGIVSEESEDENVNAEHVWYIDPIDGTRNFETRVPLFEISIALAHRNKITHAGIYLPTTHEFFYAEGDKKTTLNNIKITCSKKDSWDGTYGIGMVTAGKPVSIKFQQKLYEISKGTAWINGIASVVISSSWTADGRRDWYITPNDNSWDLAAGYLIMKNAGCVVTNLKGEDWVPGNKGLIATNKHLYPEFFKIAEEVFPPTNNDK